MYLKAARADVRRACDRQASRQTLDNLSGDEAAEDAIAVQVQVSHMLGGAMKLLDRLSGELETARVPHGR